MARGLKFWIYEEEELYYQCSENKGADQLRGYREADLRLCFRICKKKRFSHGAAHILATLMQTNLLGPKRKKLTMKTIVLYTLFIRKPVLGISNQIRLKLAFKATKTRHMQS